jgi:F0F1-type ATP synthase assembly protein I
LDDKPHNTEPRSPEVEKVKRYSTQAALAMELPFTIVGAVLLFGLLGYFLDRWLHTKLIFTLLLGGIGFAVGIKEVLRRLSQSDS